MKIWERERGRAYIRGIGIGWAIVTLLGLMNVSGSLLGGSIRPPYTVFHYLTTHLCQWYSIGILALGIVPLTIWLADRRTAWWALIPVHIVICGVLYGGFLVLDIGLDRLACLILGPYYSLSQRIILYRHLPGFDFSAFFQMFMTGFISEFLTAYMLCATAGYMVRAARISRENRMRTLYLESDLNLARMQTLSMQLQPHFLFNTLNAIACLIHIDPDGAERMLHQLARLLRLTLEHREKSLVSLRQELEFLDLYLDIQQTRFGDRLRLVREIEGEVLDLSVPFLILQPVVENALRHGVSRAAGSCTVALRVRIRENGLQMVVQDDGPGLAPQWTYGTGLSNVSQRLEHLYGADASFRLEEPPEGGVRALVEIPLKQTGRSGGEEIPCGMRGEVRP